MDDKEAIEIVLGMAEQHRIEQLATMPGTREADSDIDEAIQHVRSMLEMMRVGI